MDVVITVCIYVYFLMYLQLFVKGLGINVVLLAVVQFNCYVNFLNMYNFLKDKIMCVVFLSIL